MNRIKLKALMVLFATLHVSAFADAPLIEEPPSEYASNFVECMTRYIEGRYTIPTTLPAGYDFASTLKQAEEIIVNVAPICPNPYPVTQQSIDTDIENSHHLWMVARAMSLLSWGDGKEHSKNKH